MTYHQLFLNGSFPTMHEVTPSIFRESIRGQQKWAHLRPMQMFFRRRCRSTSLVSCYFTPRLTYVGMERQRDWVSEASITMCTFLLDYSFIRNLSIIIGFEEMESRPAFDVMAPWFPIYPLIFLVIPLKILQVKQARRFKLAISDFPLLLLLKTQFWSINTLSLMTGWLNGDC